MTTPLQPLLALGVMRRDYGSDIFELIDGPLNDTHAPYDGDRHGPVAVGAPDQGNGGVSR